MSFSESNPNQPHGFSKGASPAALKFYNDASAFLLKDLPSGPRALGKSIVKAVAARNKRAGRNQAED